MFTELALFNLSRLREGMFTELALFNLSRLREGMFTELALFFNLSRLRERSTDAPASGG